MSMGTAPPADAASLRKDILAEVSSLLAIETEKMRASVEAASAERIRLETANIVALNASIQQDLTERCKLVLVDVTDLRSTVNSLVVSTERTVNTAVEPLRREVAALGPAAEMLATAMTAMRESERLKTLEDTARWQRAEQMAADNHALIFDLMTRLSRIMPPEPAKVEPPRPPDLGDV